MYYNILEDILTTDIITREENYINFRYTGLLGEKRQWFSSYEY